MKQKINLLSRMGMRKTPPCLRVNGSSKFLKSLILLFVLMLGVGNVWGQSYTYKDFSTSFYLGTSSGASAIGTNVGTSTQMKTISSSNDLFSGVSEVANVFYNSSGCGLRISSSKNVGSITLTLSSALQDSTIYAIVVYASKVSGNTAAKCDVTPAGGYTTTTTFANGDLTAYSTAFSGSNYELDTIKVGGKKMTSITFASVAKGYTHLHKVTLVTQTPKATVTQYNVTETLTNVTASGDAHPTKVAATATDLTMNYTAASGYTLPDAVTVTMGGQPLTADDDYTWEDGELMIMPSAFTGDIAISIAGVPAAQCQNSITITKGTESNGTFTLSQTGTVCIDDGNATVTVSNITPTSVYYRLASVTSIGANSATVGSVAKVSDTEYSVTGINANTTITANFEPIADYTITLNAGSGSVTADGWTLSEGVYTKTSNQAITLPSASPSEACATQGWTFVGWAASSVDATTEPTMTAAGTTTPAESTTYYAVYRASGASNNFTKITDAASLTTDDYMILGAYSTTYYSMKNSVSSGSMNEGSYSSAGATLSNVTDATQIWKLITLNGKLLIYSANSSKYFAITDAGTVSMQDDPQYFTCSMANGGAVTLTSPSTNSKNQLIYSSNFVSGSTQSKAVYLYKRGTTTANIWKTNPSCTSLTLTAVADVAGGGNVYTSGTSFQEGDVAYATYTKNDGFNFTGWTISGTGASIDNAQAQIVKVTMGSENATITANFAQTQKHKVYWSQNGDKSQYDEVAEGDDIVFPATATGCDDKVFRGWSSETITGVTQDEPEYVTSATMGTKDTTFYAVFATENGDTPETTETLSYSYSSHEGWTLDNCFDKSSYIVLQKNASLTSPSFDVSKIQSITGNLRTYGSTDYTTVNIKCGSAAIGTISATNGSTMASATASLSGLSSLSGTSSLVFTPNSSASEKGPGIKDLTITYKTGGTTYSDFVTTCSSKTLESIAINTENVNKKFFVGETFSSTGLVVTATYSEGEPAIVSPDSIKGYNMATASEQTVTVYYTYKGVTRTQAYTINVYSVNITKVGHGDLAGNAATFDPATRQITVTSAEHYTFQGFSNVSGATLSGTASPYTLSDPTANVTMTATWEAAQERTISFTDKMHNISVDSKQVYDGETFEFPVLANQEIEAGTCKGDHKYFYGWVLTAKEDDFEEGDILKGTSATVSGAASYTAVWGDDLLNVFYLINDVTDITTGNYLLSAYYNSKENALGNTLSSKKIAGVEVTYDEETGSITTTNNNLVWTITKDNSNYSLYNAAAGKYLNIIADDQNGQLALESTAGYYTVANGTIEVDEGKDPDDYAKPIIFTSTTITTQQIEFYNGNYCSYKNQAVDIYLYKSYPIDYKTKCIMSDVEFTVTDKELVVNDQVADLNAWISNISEGYDGTFTFASDNEEVFMVDGVEGLAYAQGTCTLTVTAPAKGNWNETIKTINITVKEPTGKSVTVTAKPVAAATSVSATPNNNVQKGDSVTLAYVAATGYTFDSWYALDGEAQEITVTNNKFAMPATDVEVEARFTAIAVTGVTLNKATTKLEIGANETLTATIAPADALVKTVTWNSDAESVATVVDGVVTAVAAGTANITVTTTDGSFQATCVVTVVAPAPFAEYTGALVEGDYIICSGTTAVKNTVNNSRLQGKTVTVSNKKISEYTADIVWHISADGDWWNIYSADAQKYAAFTSGDGKSDVISSVTDYARWQWANSDFSNKGKTSKYLRLNSGYGFGSYGTGTGSTLTLYKKESTDPEITLDPDEFDFGDVKDNATKDQQFTISANAYVQGELAASIEGTDAGLFNVGSIVDNKVTVTFNPNGTVKNNVSAVLTIAATNANVSASLTGNAITHEIPEITLNKEVVDFGTVQEGAPISAQTVTATLAYLSEANVTITTTTGSAFAVSPTTLTASGDITITPSTSNEGEFTETLTVSGDGATAKQVTVKMTVASKWAITYTSNVAVGSDKVKVNGESTEYEAYKAGTSKIQGSTTVKFPQGTTDIHLHAAGWKGESVTIAVKNGTTTLGTCNLTADNGATGDSPFTLANDPASQYFHIALSSALAEETTITFSATSGNRFILYGVNQVGGPEMTGIEIYGAATKLEYFEGETFNPAGLKVRAIYNTGDPKDLSAGYTLTYDPETLSANQASVNVTAHYNEFNSAAFTVNNLNVKAIVVESLKLGGNYQTTFHLGDEFNHTGLTVTAVKNNSTEEVVTDDAKVSTPDMTTAGQKTVTVSYSGVNKTYNILVLDGSIVFYESFDGMNTASHKGGNDGNWKSSQGDLVKDNSTLTVNNANGGYKCVRLGSGSDKGSVVIPAIPAGGDFILTFRAGAWDSNSEKTGLTITSTSGTLSQSSVTMTIAAWTEYAIVLTGASENFQITIAASQASNNRFFLDDIKLQTADHVRTGLTPGKIITVCLPYAATTFVGGEFYAVEKADATVKNILFYGVDALEAGHAYVVNPTANVLAVVKEGDAVTEAVPVNGLVGNLGSTNIEVPVGDIMIYNNELRVCGQYCEIPQYRAYIDVSELPHESVIGDAPARRLNISGHGIATAIDYLTEDGVDANAAAKKVIIDNQMFIIRNGRMYNAAGALVK